MIANRVFGLMLICFFCRLGIASASVPVIGIDPATDIADRPNPNQLPGHDEGHFNGTFGWSFYVTSPITITGVGWYDENRDGLSHPHRIGLWYDLSGASEWPYVLTSAPRGGTLVNAEQLLFWDAQHIAGSTDGITIPAGTFAELEGPWRKTALPEGPMVLSPGGYVLGGLDDTNSTDSIRAAGFGSAYSMPSFPSNITVDQRIIVGGQSVSNGTGFLPPGSFLGGRGVEMGPMLFVEPVPEPSSALLLLAGIASIGRWWR